MLRWYAALAVLSRGSTILGLLAVSFILDAADYGLIGIAFVAITTSSQAFGYPGYLAALNAKHSDRSKSRRPFAFLTVLALGAFCFVMALFWWQLASEHYVLLLIAALASAAVTASTTMNGVLQKLQFESFAAKNTGIFLVPFVAIAVVAVAWLGLESLILAVFLAHSLALVRAFHHLQTSTDDPNPLALKYGDFALFAMSGLASSLLLLPAANLLFARGGATEMGQFTLALQIRAVLIFGAGVIGAEMLSRYSQIAQSNQSLRMKNMLADLGSIVKWLGAPVLAAYVIISAVDIEAYQPIFDQNAVSFMLASGIFVCVTVPFSRAITALYSEAWNVAVIFMSSAISVAALLWVPGNAQSFSLIFALNSFLSLLFSGLVFFYLYRFSRSAQQAD